MIATIYVIGFLVNVLFAIIQSKMIASGVSQLELDRYGDVKKIHNSFLGQNLMPSWWILFGFIWPLAWIACLVDRLDSPKSRKNRLIKDAEEQGLDLKEFVKKDQVAKFK